MENIKSYAYDNSKIGNGWDGWKDEYANFLKEEVFGESKRRYPRVYCDPDEGNTEYYIRLCQFLNVQEKIIPEDKRFSYCVEEYNKVCRIRVYKDGESKFYLKTDQFGFSAPMKKNGAVVQHPFAKYYEEEKGENKEKVIENIVEWIYTTRSLGGAFIWPEVKGTSYNMLRGGKIPRFNGRYMQDRVDLALLEVLHFLASNDEKYEIDYKEDMLYSQIKNEDSHMREWLKHFGTFETFIKFFLFDDFVEKRDESICGVKSIIDGEKLNDIGRKNCELPQDAERLYEVFDRIAYMIKERTKKINIIIMEKEIKA